MPFTFAKGQVSLAGSFLCDFVFCQEPRLLPSFKIHMGLENLENPQIFVEMMKMQSWLFQHPNGLVYPKIFWRTICFMLGSSLRFSRRSRSFCDNPFALDFVEEDELCSVLTSFLLGVNGAFALSNIGRL